ncbi:MAG: HAD family phosphatase [Acidimicrobiia bacterium]|nr:HAD family phosphatase [Acidimicrobiia bacterium]
MIRAILWDNDGVLVDTEHLYFQANRDVLASIGIDLAEEQYLDLFMVQGCGAWHLAEQRGLPPAEIERLRDERNARYTRLLRLEPRGLPGVEDVLAALHGKYVMGVVTSSRKDHFAVIHEATGFLKYFDFVVASGDYARSKPAPDPYLLAVDRSGVAVEECLAIEDSERGLAAALAAGLRCVVVPSGLTRRQTFSGAHRVLGSVSEVPAFVAEW